MKLRLIVGVAALVAVGLVGCSTHQPKLDTLDIAAAAPAVEQVSTDGETITVASDDGSFRQFAVHETITTVSDITDPAHPRELWRGGNIIGQCGVRNMMSMLMGNTGRITLGPCSPASCVTGGNDSLGKRCAGVLDDGQTFKVACPYDENSQIVVGAGSASSCTGSGSPWACCTGSGTGCTPSGMDVILFSEGQPNGSLTGIQSAWQSNAVSPSNTTRKTVDGVPKMYWNESNLEGIQFVATFDGSTGNHQWCEYAVRTASSPGCGPVSTSTAVGLVPGWQLNHAVIDPCISKSSGQIFQITVTITFA